jgi:hypothetical protein
MHRITGVRRSIQLEHCLEQQRNDSSLRDALPNMQLCSRCSRQLLVGMSLCSCLVKP